MLDGGDPGPASLWGRCEGSLPQALRLRGSKLEWTFFFLLEWTLSWWWQWHCEHGTRARHSCFQACTDCSFTFFLRANQTPAQATQ